MEKKHGMCRKILKIGLCVFIAAAAAATVLIPPFERNRAEDAEDVKEAYDENDMKVIISLGETSESVFISWSEPDNKDFSMGEISIAKVAEKGAGSDSIKELKAEKRSILNSGHVRYWIEVKGLKPGREYQYTIGDGKMTAHEGEFRTVRDSGTIRFLYLGDVQFEDSAAEYEEWERMTEKIYEENNDIDFAVIGGDMVNSPTDSYQWDMFLEHCGVFSRLPLMTVSGNHEGVSSNNTYKKIFAIPSNGPKTSDNVLDGEFYCFDCGEARFVMMDSSFLTDDRMEAIGRQEWKAVEGSVEKWLGHTLDSGGKEWLITVVHHPVYGMHEGDYVSRRIRRLWAPIMEKGGVDMVFCGHQHMYMRTKNINGIVYIMGNSGMRTSEYYNGHNAPFYSRAVYGGGPNYQIVTISDSKIELTSFNEKGLVIDETEIDKGSGLHIFEFFRGD